MMKMGEATLLAREIFGSASSAHSVRYTTWHGHFRFYYFIGTMHRGRYFPRYSGTSYERCFDQVEASAFRAHVRCERAIRALASRPGPQAEPEPLRRHDWEVA
jgi:hypothetical protein